jgi:hypothetical protein
MGGLENCRNGWRVVVYVGVRIRTKEILRDRLMVGQEPLKLLILVRFQIPQHESEQYRGLTGEDIIYVIRNKLSSQAFSNQVIKNHCRLSHGSDVF